VGHQLAFASHFSLLLETFGISHENARCPLGFVSQKRCGLIERSHVKAQNARDQNVSWEVVHPDPVPIDRVAVHYKLGPLKLPPVTLVPPPPPLAFTSLVPSRMASSHFHQTTPSRASDTSELLCSETSDTIHHGPGPHSFLPPHQCQEYLFPQALDFLTLVSQFQFDIPPTTPFPLPSADQFASWSLQDITTPTGGLSPQEVVHQEEPSVHDIFSSIWDEGCLISDQTTALHDRVHQHTFNFEYSSLESYLAEDMSSSASNKMITCRVSTIQP